MKNLRVLSCLLVLSACGFAEAQAAEPSSLPEVQAPSTAPASLVTPLPRTRLRIASGVMAGQRIYGPSPEIPAGVSTSGGVVLHVILGKDGSVQSMELLHGSPELARAVMNTVKQWKYKPYLLNGEPVEVETTISMYS